MISEIKANNLYEELNEKNKTSYQEEYILGPGDVLTIGFLEAFEFSGQYSIGPDGLIYLPEIGPLKAADLTITELNEKLKQEFDTYLINPSFTIYLKSYRTVKTLVIGEVVRPGFYNLGGVNLQGEGPLASIGDNKNQSLLLEQNQANLASSNLFPTLYDFIRQAGGITLYSDIKNIEVIRKNSLSKGGGKIKTNINLLSLLEEGDQSQNIRIYDGDTIIVKKSLDKIGKQIVQARKTNLNPDTINVFIGGNVKFPGRQEIPTGSGLNQAVELAGGRRYFLVQ